MKKLLVYVDAENVVIEDLIMFQKTLSRETGEDCFVVGRFYGSRKEVGAVFDRCCSMGLDFIDTTHLTGKSKNATDMKIACDCMADVLMDLEYRCQKVYIVSHDRDFLPLIHKLLGLGCSVVSPFLEGILERKTVKDLTTALGEMHFEWAVRARMSDNLFKLVRESVPNEFMDNIIEEYVDMKKVKLERAFRDVVGTDSERIMSIRARDFGFARVYAELGTRMSPEEAFTIYTKKIYGYFLSDEEIRMQINRSGVTMK